MSFTLPQPPPARPRGVLRYQGPRNCPINGPLRAKMRGMVKLTQEEREVIVIYNDAEKAWRVYSDSATIRGTILKVARQVGAEVQKVGSHGIEFTCPGDALRLTAKRHLDLSPEQRAARRARAFRPAHSVRAREAQKTF